MNNTYLVGAVGVPLTQCLGELVEKTPKDPIEWIAHWLYRYMDKELYFYEKAIFLKDLQRMRLELEKDRQRRQGVINAMNSEIYDIKKETKMDVDAMNELILNQQQLAAEGALGGAGGGVDGTGRGRRGLGGGMEDGEGEGEASRRRRWYESVGGGAGRGLHGEYGGGSEYDSETGMRRSKSKHRGSDSGHHTKHSSRHKYGLEGSAVDPREMTSEEGTRLGMGSARWCLDCNIGLVCDHSVLGLLQGRPPAPFVCPESPEWWELRAYLLQNLYDHEIYTTDFEEVEEAGDDDGGDE